MNYNILSLFHTFLCKIEAFSHNCDQTICGSSFYLIFVYFFIRMTGYLLAGGTDYFIVLVFEP